MNFVSDNLKKGMPKFTRIENFYDFMKIMIERIFRKENFVANFLFMKLSKIFKCICFYNFFFVIDGIIF